MMQDGTEGVDVTADRVEGTLLGTALGDALGLPAEGLTAATIARRFGHCDRFHLLGRTGFVSDDTEQSALIAQSIARIPDDPAACTRAFRRALLGWFLRLPWGIGFGTLRACGKIALGISPSGVFSAGNGAAMRAAIIGAVFHDDADRRRAFGVRLAEVTHRDPRAVEGALFVADVTAACVGGSTSTREECTASARQAVSNAELAAALDQALELAARDAPTSEAPPPPTPCSTTPSSAPSSSPGPPSAPSSSPALSSPSFTATSGSRLRLPS